MMQELAVREQLAAVEARYAALLDELANLFHVREQLRRALPVAGVAPSGSAPAPEPLRVLSGGIDSVGGEETGAGPAPRLAHNQGTRARLRVLEGGRAAS